MFYATGSTIDTHLSVALYVINVTKIQTLNTTPLIIPTPQIGQPRATLERLAYHGFNEFSNKFVVLTLVGDVTNLTTLLQCRVIA